MNLTLFLGKMNLTLFLRQQPIRTTAKIHRAADQPPHPHRRPETAYLAAPAHRYAPVKVGTHRSSQTGQGEDETAGRLRSTARQRQSVSEPEDSCRRLLR